MGSCSARATISILNTYPASSTGHWALHAWLMGPLTGRSEKCSLFLRGQYLLTLFHKRYCGCDTVEGKSSARSPVTVASFPFTSTSKRVLCSYHIEPIWPCSLSGHILAILWAFVHAVSSARNALLHLQAPTYLLRLSLNVIFSTNISQFSQRDSPLVLGF